MNSLRVIVNKHFPYPVFLQAYYDLNNKRLNNGCARQKKWVDSLQISTTRSHTPMTQQEFFKTSQYICTHKTVLLSSNWIPLYVYIYISVLC